MSTPDSPTPDHAPIVPPLPAYGEYASPEHAARAHQAQQNPSQVPAPQQDQYPPQGYYGTQQHGPRPVRVGDLVASIILLGIGLLATLITVLNAFTIQPQMEALYEQYGASGSYTPGAAQTIASAVLIVSHLLILTLAVVFTTVLIRKRKLAFWVPLTAGAVAAVIFIGTFVVLILVDPNLYDALLNSSQL